MATQCPSCSSKLRVLALKQSFACPSCGTRLELRMTGLLILISVLWVPFDLPLMLYATGERESEPIWLAIYFVISVVAAFALYAWLARYFLRVAPHERPAA